MLYISKKVSLSEEKSVAMFESLTVELGARSYPVLLGDTAEWLPELHKYIANRKVLVISDENICRAGHLQKLLGELKKFDDVSAVDYVLAPGEEYKTLASVENICRAAVNAGLDRSSVFIALSGGVAGDLTGFAAAIYMRGVDFIQLPTTLMAAVDSSVGGKTGADLPEGKNLVGAFHQPRLVAMDMNVLDTLPESQWRNGLAEIVKYGMIMDKEFFALLENNVEKLNSFDKEFYCRIIRRSCACKAEVVASDECEKGRRAILNYGHTAGHAVEKLSNFTLPHGMAVAIGMAAAARLAVLMKLCPAEVEMTQNRLLKKLSLPVNLPEHSDIEAIISAMHSDKKNSKNGITMVLPTAVGSVEIVRGIDEKLLCTALGDIL